MKAGWRLASLAFAAALVGLWQLAADHGLISRVFFPAPSRAFDVLGGIGYLGNLALERAEAWFLRWRPAVGAT